MKNNLIQLAGVMIILLLINWSCTKIESPLVKLPLALPEETQIGANTFGCKINGEVWRILTQKEWYKGAENQVSVSFFNDSIIDIHAAGPYINSIPTHSFSLLFKLKSNSYQLYTVDEINRMEMINYRNWTMIGYRSCKYCLDLYNPGGSALDGQPDKGIIIITRFDDKVVSGKFEGKLFSNSHSSVDITEGRFDIKIK